jgi:hypothetical protein
VTVIDSPCDAVRKTLHCLQLSLWTCTLPFVRACVPGRSQIRDVPDSEEVSISTLSTLDTIAWECAGSEDAMAAWIAKLATLVTPDSGRGHEATLAVNRTRLLLQRDAVVHAMTRHGAVPAIALHGLQFLWSLMQAMPTLASWRGFVALVVSVMKTHGGAVAVPSVAMLAMFDTELWRQCKSRLDAVAIGLALCRVAEEADALLLTASDVRIHLQVLMEHVVRSPRECYLCVPCDDVIARHERRDCVLCVARALAGGGATQSGASDGG